MNEMKKGFFLIGLICLSMLCFDCGKSSPYPGYSASKNGFYFKLVRIGESGRKCQYNDFITADISYATLHDSVFFKGRRKFQISAQNFKGSIDECLTLINKDDSASFILSASDFFKKTLSATSVPSFIHEGDQIKININIIDIQTDKEFAMEKEAFMKWTEDFGLYEKTILKQFLNGSKLKITPLPSGMYFLTLKKGNEKSVSIGDTVTVHYEGKFLNGKYFDSTRQRNEAFQFVFGQQWQVVKGLEEAIGIMHEGEKALFIMPSELAFGENGSSTGIIPPFTSLIFEVELVNIGKKFN